VKGQVKVGNSWYVFIASNPFKPKVQSRSHMFMLKRIVMVVSRVSYLDDGLLFQCDKYFSIRMEDRETFINKVPIGDKRK
jgi:hypothetical protein